MYTSNAYKYDVRRLEDEIANLESEAAIAEEPMRDAILEIITSMTNELALCDERWQIEGTRQPTDIEDLAYNGYSHRRTA